ncbi:MAG: hypothetical protein AB7G93_04915 [Bdellovibrionales bacterium]
MNATGVDYEVMLSPIPNGGQHPYCPPRSPTPDYNSDITNANGWGRLRTDTTDPTNSRYWWPLMQDPMTCRYTGSAAPGPGLYRVPYSSRKLLATRGGYFDANLFNASAGDAAVRTARARLLPMNFSVARFAEALDSNDPGELGWHLARLGRAFNGVIYITAQWPGRNGLIAAGAGSESGYGANVDLDELMWPPQGTGAGDTNQIPDNGRSGNQREEQRVLPYSLCSDVGTEAGSAGSPFDGEDEDDPAAPNPLKDPEGTVRFQVPPCANYTRAGFNAFVNSVQVVEGSDLARFANTGLTIASNLPVIMATPFNTGASWAPALVAGDIVLMNGPNVGAPGGAYARYTYNRWSDRPHGVENQGAARFNGSIITGYNHDPSSSGAWSNFRVPSNYIWHFNQGTTFTWNGSVAHGWAPVFYRTGRVAHNWTMTGYIRIRPEPRYDDPLKRPPGMPKAWSVVLRQWRHY